jgi:maltose alpha-D-glucosyltransferase/alpha-amylase
MIGVKLESGAEQRYFLPLAVDWSPERVGAPAAAALARVRQRAATGFLFDAFAEENFCRDLVARIRAEETMTCTGGRIEFRRTAALADLLSADLDAISVRKPATEGTNSAFLLGDELFLKAYRRVRGGVNPEWEMGRFLTDVSPCEATVRAAGALEYVAPTGERATLALLQESVKNQGDAWSFTLNYLERTLEVALTHSEAAPPADISHAEYFVLMRTLAQRTADLHRALCVRTGDPAFDPEPFDERHLAEWRGRLDAEIGATMAMLARHPEALADASGARRGSGPDGGGTAPDGGRTAPDEARQRPDSAAGRHVGEEAARERLELIEARLRKRVADLAARPVQGLATRFHGDYHLGQALICGADFIIVDLEGEPGRSFDERRRKATPLKDVAAMLRSFDYAKGAAARSLGAERLVDEAEVETLLAQWRDEVREVFVAAYRDAMQGCAACPQDPDSAQRLIELARIEKLLYELRYELQNRPDWLSLPWRDLEELGE